MKVKQYGGKSGKVWNQGESKQHGNYHGAVQLPVKGEPDLRLINTSYVERTNLTLRMGQRRFARRTNAFSKTLSGGSDGGDPYQVWPDGSLVHLGYDHSDDTCTLTIAGLRLGKAFAAWLLHKGLGDVGRSLRPSH